MSVGGFAGGISSVQVTVNVSGGYNGDLYAYLVAPNGTMVVLLNRIPVTRSVCWPFLRTRAQIIFSSSFMATAPAARPTHDAFVEQYNALVKQEADINKLNENVLNSFQKTFQNRSATPQYNLQKILDALDLNIPKMDATRQEFTRSLTAFDDLVIRTTGQN